MRSNFSSARSGSVTNAKQTLDEVYDLKGLNLLAPDQVMPEGETPFAVNNRRYADNAEETSVAMRTRQGSSVLSTPVGESIDVQNTNTGTGDIVVDLETIAAIPFTAGSNDALTMFKLFMKKSVNTRGYVIIKIYTSQGDLPYQLVATSSIAPSAITGTYAEVFARFMDASALVNGDDYFAVVSMQEFGAGTYYIQKVASGAVLTSTDGLKTYTVNTYGAKFKAYTSDAGFIKGFIKRNPEVAPNRTVFGMGQHLYEVPDSPAVPAELGSNLLDVASTVLRMPTIDERTFIIDGVTQLRWWDGTYASGVLASSANVTDVGGVPTALGVPVNGLIFENRLLTVPHDDQTRVDFSALYDFETWPSDNFFYIGRPLSKDWITAWHEFREAATIFTKEMKYTLTGTDIETFQPIPHRGTKGAISQEATAVGKENIYFMADDLNIYAWNGTNDTLISKKVRRELKKILDKDKVRLHLYNNQLRVYYNRSPDSAVNRMLLYDIEDGEWYMDTGRAVMGSMEWTFDNNELVEFSSKCGWLFFGESSYSDLGKPISFKYWTAYKPYGSGIAKDRIKKFRPIVRPAQSNYYLMVGKDVDFKNTPIMRPWLVDSGGAPWGSFNWGDGTVYGGSALVDNASPMSGRGKLTQYRFEHEGIEQPVFLLGYAAIVKVGRPR